MSDVPSSVGPALRRTEPDRLADVTAEYLNARYPGSRVEILVADYRTSGLWPLLTETHGGAGPLGDHGSAARAYRGQRLVVEELPEGWRVLLPLSVWSDRLGVLIVDLIGEPTVAHLDELATVADDLAFALAAADRSTDRYRRARRRQRMTMAAEMQWDLLPGRALGGPDFALAGQLEPAYAVCGDHFDWSLDGRRLTVTALNGSGEGLSATMLTLLAVNAMRNARRSGGNLIEQAELASETVYGLHAGRRHAATLLVELDLTTGLATMIDAGSPLAFRMRQGQVLPLHLEAQLPLGMFAETSYKPEFVTLEPGDRLFVVSDGVHGAAPAGLAAFGEKGLIPSLRSTRLQPPAEAVGSVLRGLHEYHHDNDLADDAVVVCLDWHGAGDENGRAHRR